jgi:tetratricopeptide (TPR) repeat protein
MQEDSIEYWHIRGRNWARAGRYQEAIFLYEQALKVDPQLTDVWYDLGEVYRESAKRDEALACYDRALEIDPHSALALRGKAFVLRELGRRDEALACVEQALAINPRLSLAWRTKGAILRDLGRHEEGLACYEQALEIDPTDPLLWMHKGNTLLVLDRMEEAFASYEQALAINPQMAEALYGQARALDKLGTMAEARKRYQEFLDKASFAQDRLVDEVRRRMADLLSASKQDKPPVLHPITYTRVPDHVFEPLKIGDLIAGRYEIRRILGGREGHGGVYSGMEIVYVVYNHEHHAVFALKTFHDRLLTSKAAREAFTREAHIWIALDRHPYIVRAYWIGDTMLMLAPPHWHRLRNRELVVDYEVSPVLNLALAHCDTPLVRRLVVRNWSASPASAHTLQIVLSDFADVVSMPVPALDPGQSMVLTVPPCRFNYEALEGRVEKTVKPLIIRLVGSELQQTSANVWVLAANEWACEPTYPSQLSLAAFVLPNHPLVERVVSAACQHLPAAHSADKALQAIYEYLLHYCSLSYRFEPPSWESYSQKIRLPHQVFPNSPDMSGQGTCIDLALFIAACLEQLQHQPLIALLDMGVWWHAMVGCWTYRNVRLEPVLTERDRIMQHAVWVDPNGCTQEPDYR